jgi:TPR repeat protein
MSVTGWPGEPDLAELEQVVRTRRRYPYEAMTRLKVLAERGSAMAMVFLGDSYRRGIGTDKDLAQSEEWYRRAADAGSVLGLYLLGRLFILQGRYDEAKSAFHFAAAGGYPPATSWLGRMYYFGWGGEKNIARAKLLLEEASARGNIIATSLLGHLLVKTHVSRVELLRGMFLMMRAYVDSVVALCVEGMDSDKFR